MSTTPVTLDKDVDNIIDGLTGDFRIGERYYIFTVTYAYIGVIEKTTDAAIHLSNTWIVSQAGHEVDAVTRIVHGSKVPEKYEILNAPIFLMRQALVTAIKMMA